MKILVINGQNHHGSSYNMAHILLDKINNKEEVIEYFLPRDLPHFCCGCYTCVTNEDKCPYYEEKKKFYEAFEKCDLFIFTSPNYCLGPSGSMKAFLDLFFDLWMVHRPKEYMFKKKAIILSCSAGASCKMPIKIIKSSLCGWGIPTIYSYGDRVAATNWKEVKQKKKDKIDKKITRIAKVINKEKKVKVKLFTRIYFTLMGMMHKKGWDASKVEQVYWKDKGWLDKGRPYPKIGLLILSIISFTLSIIALVVGMSFHGVRIDNTNPNYQLGVNMGISMLTTFGAFALIGIALLIAHNIKNKKNH